LKKSKHKKKNGNNVEVIRLDVNAKKRPLSKKKKDIFERIQRKDIDEMRHPEEQIPPNGGLGKFVLYESYISEYDSIK
jgi:hypothetical protein